MNQIARRSTTLPTLPEDADRALRHLLDQIVSPHPDVGIPTRFTAKAKDAAVNRIAILDPLCVPASMGVMSEWLRPIGAAVRNPPSPKDFTAWATALVVACDSIAVGAFNASTQRQALQSFQFFPSVADVCGVVSPVSRRLKMELAALRRIVAAETAEPLPERPSGTAPVPDWVGGRTVRGVSWSGDCDRTSTAVPPTRTVEEQLAILRAAG